MNRIFFSWPSASSGVMGGEQAAATMEAVAYAGAKRRGTEPNLDALAKQSAAIISHFLTASVMLFTAPVGCWIKV